MTRAELLRAYRAACAAHDPSALVARSLATERAARVRVIAIGKAAGAMAEGARAALGDRAVETLVVAPDEASVGRGPRVRVLRSAHPLPDVRSVRAARACLAFASAGDADVLLVLVSGGASALVALPAQGVTLADKRAVTDALLRAGVDVRTLNAVRIHLSAIKGGRLLAAAGAKRVLTLVTSDVVGGVASDVGSGPSMLVPDRRVLVRSVLARHAPRFATLPLARVPSRAPSHRVRVVSSPETFARAMADALRARGLEVRVLPPSTAPVSRLAAAYLRFAADAPRGSAFVRAAEPSVVVPPGRGRGGRNTHLATLVGAGLPRGAWFAAIATDGVDGASRTGGAIVDGRFAARAGDRLGRALAGFDTGSLHRAIGTAIPCGPSGHNHADLHVLVVGGSSPTSND